MRPEDPRKFRHPLRPLAIVSPALSEKADAKLEDPPELRRVNPEFLDRISARPHSGAAPKDYGGVRLALDPEALDPRAGALGEGVAQNRGDGYDGTLPRPAGPGVE